MGLLDIIKKAGHGIVQGVDNAAYNSLGGGLLGSAIPQPAGGLLGPTPMSNSTNDDGIPVDPSVQPSMSPVAPVSQQFKPNPAQTRNMRSDFLMSIGSALQQHRPLAEGIQDYQQRTVGQLQAGQAAQQAQATQQARLQAQQEMQGAVAQGDEKGIQQVAAKWGMQFPELLKAYEPLIKSITDKGETVPVGDIGYLNKKTGVFTSIPHDPKTQTPEQAAFADLQKKYGNDTDAFSALEAIKKPAPDKPTPFSSERAYMTQAGGDPDNPKTWTADVLTKFHSLNKPEKAAAPVVNVQMSGDAIDQAANAYLQTGALPAVGMGKDASVMRTRIMNRAAEINPTADLAGAKTDYGANKGAITSLEKQQAAVNTFENTASKNLDLADSISKKVDRTGSPVLNRFLLHAKGQYAGDTDTQLLNNAVETAASEYAKVVSGGMTGGPVSDAARQHARDMLTSAMSQGTFSQAVALMKQEMGNRRSGYTDQLQQLRSNRPGAAPAVTNGQAAGGWKVIGVK